MSYNEIYSFPNPETSDDQGLLFIGGDLSPQRILQAYRQGVFPWYEPGTPILWWSPNPRLILIPTEFKVSHSLQKSIKKPFGFTVDTVFREVMMACATCSGRKNNTWITREMIEAYTQLHTMGYAHSFEIWNKNELVGGLYGLSLGRVFFGESMFHKLTDASKIAFYYLCKTMAKWNFDFIDCQIPTNHLQSLGAKIIERKEFLHLLRQSLEHPTKQGSWNITLP
ncbi:leucyl/phenylalanyl-tRNA--protein transferase [Legionella sp. PATHC038]|uniref:leucyl/phenylalanyl-tRNA--protein transferase n=1 Tax=Legionella sheltonii TaxID=2992041 RepID=UPI0022431EAE|nr:leucyl/phenylalanyl-tRNA--protein transferase [Legionella sp. PATHC038]MCW8397666.1 leucyl/phenylalanyl-tRNA--protein transferase [Legionella sp. PATHC038]